MNNNWKNNRGRNNMGRGNNRGGWGRGRGGRGGSRGGYWGPPASRGNYRGSRNQSGDRLNNFEGRYFNQKWQPQKHEAPSKRLSEVDIGVTEYISEHDGFNGIIKSRYSDFQVSEINEKGEVAKLTDTSVPEVPKDEDVEDDEDLLLNKYNLEILPMETWDKINNIATCTKPSDEKVEIDVTGKSKEERTKIHDAVKKAFGESIVGSTVTKDDKKFVTFVKYRKGVRIDNRVKWVWPGEYVHFIVYKENCDTMEAASRIAERLKINLKPSMIGYAGTKDRRAKTTQWFSLRKVDPRKIHAACGGMREMRAGNYSFHSHQLKLGMLKGNQFRICLRNITVPDEVVDKACGLLKDNGFINYYGLQRFGTRIEAPTYEIGLKLLQGDFKAAIDCILQERSGPLQQALAAYRREDARAALRHLPRGDGAEGRLLRALADCPHDLLGALDRIARNSRLLYLHSYQSLVWNRVLSRRLQQLGRKPAVGDLVPLDDVVEEYKDDCDVDQENDDGENTEKSDKDDTDDENVDNEDTTTDDKKENTTDDKNEDTTDDKSNKKKSTNTPKKVIPVKVLTQEDVDSGRYTIFDVILPLPGYNIEYPPNMKEYYEELLTKDGLKLDMRHKYKSYSMSGSYRHIVCRASSLSWQTVSYSDPFSDLILSDADEMDRVTNTGVDPDGKYRALLLCMTLPTSSYATMALRELLRVDTSSNNHAAQNAYYKNKAKKNNQDDDKSDNDDENGKNDENNDKANGQDEQMNVETGEERAEKRKLSDDSDVDSKKSKQND